MEAAILSLSVCFSDVKNKASMCGTNVFYVMNQP